MLFKCILFSQQNIGDGNGKSIGKAKGKGTSKAQKKRNDDNNSKRSSKPDSKCPNYDICKCSSSYANTKRYFFGYKKKVGHFAKSQFVQKGCLKVFNQLTREELATPQWHSFAKYHPKFGAKK
jgi:hypothetical protein